MIMLIDDIPKFDFDKNEFSHEVNEYFDFYNLSFNGRYQHNFGYIDVDSKKIAAHLFRPASCKGVVFTLHGLLDHTGCLSHLIKHLLENGYAVASFDLYGHGLSDGERNSVDSFLEYVDALEKFVELCKPILNKPFHAIGFSTGGSIILEYLFTRSNVFEKKILAAPLVRSEFWKLSRIAHTFIPPFITYLPRLYRKDSSNEDFLHFRRYEDPLQDKKTSLKWVNAYFEWYDNFVKYPSLNTDVKVIQGVKDKTVSWKYNIRFLQSKLKNVDLSLIDNCGHQLFNEKKEILNEALLNVTKYLSDK